jgi:hypothetical protein
VSHASPPLVQVGFRCTPPVAAALSELARQRGSSIRRLIVTWLAQAEPEYAEVARLDSERRDARRRQALPAAPEAATGPWPRGPVVESEENADGS